MIEIDWKKLDAWITREHDDTPNEDEEDVDTGDMDDDS